WDAADWKVIHPLLDDGKMPALGRLIERGAMANLATLHPVLSPMLWTSIATGKRPFKHGVHGFSEPTPDGQSIQPITNLSRKTKALWNILSQNGLSSNVVGWWPSHPAEPIRGVMVSNHFQRAVGPPDQPWPAPPRSVHPPRMTERLAELRLNPNELTSEHILPFIPRAGEIDQDQDRRLASCAKILAECSSVHSVATWLMQREPWDFMAVYYDAIDHFCHGFMRYHPPRQEHVPEADFDLYRNVVESAYRYHDMMLNTLVEMAGPETTILLMSDHGFHPDHLRPKNLPAEPAGPAAEHRDFGIFVLAGPGIRQDALLHGLNLLDIAPTILSLFGLPVGEDMDGHPAAAAFENPPDVETIPSWDDVEGDAGTHSAEVQLDPSESQEAIAQLVALGYIEPPGPDREKAIVRTVRELKYNLARSYMDDDRHGAAAEILEQLYRDWPNEHRFGVQLAMCYRALGLFRDLRAVIEDLSVRRKADAEAARKELAAFVQEIRTRWKEWKQNRNDDPSRVVEAERSASDDSSTDRTGGNVDRAAEASTADDALVTEDYEEPIGYAGQMEPAGDGQSETAGNGASDKRRLLSSDERRRYRDLRARARYNPHAIDYLWGYVLLAEGDGEGALERLGAAEQIDADRPALLLQVGEAYLSLKRPEDAERAFDKAVAIDPENPHAHLGLARGYLLRRQNR
ncbi:MAG: alkaline phosphatase family protein, partial [Planctomycetota bacterium]